MGLFYAPQRRLNAGDITVSSGIRRVRLEMMFSAAGKDFIKRTFWHQGCAQWYPPVDIGKKIQTDSKLIKDMQHQSP